MDLQSRALNQLIGYARCAPSADNSQPWQFQLAEDGFTVGYAHARVAGRTFEPRAPATLLGIGAVQENIVQAAAALGHLIRVSRWPSHSSPGDIYLRTTKIGGSAAQDSDQSRAEAILDRHTNRNPYADIPSYSSITDAVKTDKQGAARTIWNEGNEVEELGGLLQKAAEIRFQTREVHEWLASSLRFSKGESSEYGDGLDVKTLALPFGGEAFMRFLAPWSRMQALNRIGAYRLMASIEATLVKKAPALVAVVSENDDDDIMDAGMLMERTWIALNAVGLAVQPYYVISDQFHRHRLGKLAHKFIGPVSVLSARCGEILDLEAHETLQILLRIGYPKKAAVRSKRLPVAELLTDTQS